MKMAGSSGIKNRCVCYSEYRELLNGKPKSNSNVLGQTSCSLFCSYVGAPLMSVPYLDTKNIDNPKLLLKINLDQRNLTIRTYS